MLQRINDGGTQAVPSPLAELQLLTAQPEPDAQAPRRRGCCGSSRVPVPGASDAGNDDCDDGDYVADHVEALMTLLKQAKPGSIYNIGGDKELENINLARLICEIMAKREMKNPSYYDDLIVSVTDRLGHDFRYAVNYQKINVDWGWRPKHQFNDALLRTIEWYLVEKTKANEMDQ